MSKIDVETRGKIENLITCKCKTLVFLPLYKNILYHSLKCPSHVQPQAVCKMIYFMNDIRSIRGGYGDIPQLLKGGF